MTLHMTSKYASELRLSQERVKYAVVGGSEVQWWFGISIASYDGTLYMVLTVRRRILGTLKPLACLST